VTRARARIERQRAKHDLRPRTLHPLRHTFATLSLESGRSVKWLSAQLRHRDAAMSWNVYAHAPPDEADDLSTLPGSGAVTARHQDGSSLPADDEGIGAAA